MVYLDKWSFMKSSYAQIISEDRTLDAIFMHMEDVLRVKCPPEASTYELKVKFFECLKYEWPERSLTDPLGTVKFLTMLNALYLSLIHI